MSIDFISTSVTYLFYSKAKMLVNVNREKNTRERGTTTTKTTAQFVS